MHLIRYLLTEKFCLWSKDFLDHFSYVLFNFSFRWLIFIRLIYEIERLLLLKGSIKLAIYYKKCVEVYIIKFVWSYKCHQISLYMGLLVWNPLNVNPTKWSNTLTQKEYVVWVCLTILGGWRLKDQQKNSMSFL